MGNLNKIKNDIINNEFDYVSLYTNTGVIKRISKEKFDIKFVVGIKGRTSYFRACLDNIVLAAKNSRLKVRIVIVEQDETPINWYYCSKYDIDYIFIPQELGKSEHYHSTSLMYNVGYLFTNEAKYNMFHCADTLISHDFFNILSENYLNKPFNWIQPYCEKRVITFNKHATNIILDLNLSSRFTNPVEFPDTCFNTEKEQQGAPGGSILIPTELFDNIGGYEPELFYGYTIEDSFLWGKLEVITNKGFKVDRIHFGNATYAEDPKLFLYHLNHPSEYIHNTKFNEMFVYHTDFFNFSAEEQLDYVNFRGNFFKKQKQKLKKIING